MLEDDDVPMMDEIKTTVGEHQRPREKLLKRRETLFIARKLDHATAPNASAMCASASGDTARSSTNNHADGFPKMSSSYATLFCLSHSSVSGRSASSASFTSPEYVAMPRAVKITILHPAV